MELAKLKHESLKDEKMRQQVRENSIELRELEKKLKAAYMNKERAAQIAEKNAIKYEQMVIMFLLIIFSVFLASFRKVRTF